MRRWHARPPAPSSSAVRREIRRDLPQRLLPPHAADQHAQRPDAECMRRSLRRLAAPDPNASDHHAGQQQKPENRREPTRLGQEAHHIVERIWSHRRFSRLEIARRRTTGLAILQCRPAQSFGCDRVQTGEYDAPDEDARVKSTHRPGQQHRSGQRGTTGNSRWRDQRRHPPYWRRSSIPCRRCSSRRTCCGRPVVNAVWPKRRCRRSAPLSPDGDIVRSLRTGGRSRLHPAWACYHTEMDVTEHGGVTIGIIGVAVGAPFAVLVAEQLFASGCKLLISVTSAGQIEQLQAPPYFVLIDRALRDEGTSHHYLPPSTFAEAAGPSLARSDLCRGECTGLTGAPRHRVATDAPYRGDRGGDRGSSSARRAGCRDGGRCPLRLRARDRPQGALLRSCDKPDGAHRR